MSDELTIRRIFNCTKRQLFDAWSNASILGEWFFAAPEKYKKSAVECSFVQGGQFSIIMYFEDETHSKVFGEYKEIIRYSLIAFSWNSPIAQDSHVELNFKSLSPNRTEMLLKHSLFPSEESRQGHNKGWDACLANLEKYVNQYLVEQI
ncbi:MAG: SRPBCC domain-containing protein [Kangiellaceae bacterium]|nr:SRPBCC domain-containing protein [Kangiellaceae bacterium]MCW9015718.1 SRPBCC domain-containing protein [Kangiellaceae bacterium]